MQGGDSDHSRCAGNPTPADRTPAIRHGCLGTASLGRVPGGKSGAYVYPCDIVDRI